VRTKAQLALKWVKIPLVSARLSVQGCTTPMAHIQCQFEYASSWVSDPVVGDW
jgi:hypothetical protein